MAINQGDDDIILSFTKTIILKGEYKLENYFIFKKGMQPYEKGKGNPPQTQKMMDERIYDSKDKIDETYKPLLRARNLHRYSFCWDGDWIKYGKNLAAPRSPEIFEESRIIIQRIISGNNIYGICLEEPYISNTDIITLKPHVSQIKQYDIRFFTAIILSKLCAFILKSQNVNLDRNAFPKINVNTLETFPIPKLDLSTPSEKSIHDEVVKYVNTMLVLNKELNETNLPDEITQLESRIKYTDKKIDELVYKMYKLTPEEIKIVEGE